MGCYAVPNVMHTISGNHYCCRLLIRYIIFLIGGKAVTVEPSKCTSAAIVLYTVVKCRSRDSSNIFALFGGFIVVIQNLILHILKTVRH